jgi:hypothetical protein
MANNYPSAKGTNRILLFGPQALSFEIEDLKKLRSTIVDEQEHSWILDVITGLSMYWEKFEYIFPKLKVIPGRKLLKDLDDALRTGDLTHLPSSLPNILLSPLVVLTQLIQYTKYLKIKNREEEQPDLYAIDNPDAETIGYCMGMLTAMTISSTTGVTEFQRYGAVAMRLAVLISGLVDAQEVSNEQKESRALATVWTSQESKMELEKILQEFPEV